jgi:hypothetical protein
VFVFVLSLKGKAGLSQLETLQFPGKGEYAKQQEIVVEKQRMVTHRGK